MGVILFEIFGKQKPFDGDSLAVLAMQVLSQPPDLTLVDANIGIVSIIGRLLAKDPLDRYRDVADVITDLYRCMATAATRKCRRTRKLLQAAHFVGRAAEMSKLQGQLETMLRGTGSVC